MTGKPVNVSTDIEVLHSLYLITPLVVSTALPASDNLNVLSGSTSIGKKLGLMQHIHSIAASVVIEILSTLLTDEMVADIIILFREETDIVRSGLDLTRLKNNILLITLATVNDDTIITILNGSSRKHIAAYLVRDKNLPGHGYTANARTLRDLTRAPKTLTVIGVVILQLLILGNQLIHLVRTILDKVINSLDMVYQSANLNLIVIETLDGQATHSRRIHLIADFSINIMLDIISNLKRMLNVKIDLHHMIIAMLLKVIIHDMMLDGRTMSDQQTGCKAIAKVNTCHTLILQLVLIRTKVRDLDGDIIDGNGILLSRIGELTECLGISGIGGQIDITGTRLQRTRSTSGCLLQAFLTDRQRRIGTMIQDDAVILMLSQPTLQHSNIVGIRLGLGEDTTQLLNLMELNGLGNGTLIGVQPSRSSRAEIETGTKQAVILRVFSDMTHIESGKVGTSTMLNNQRTACFINNLARFQLLRLIERIELAVAMRNDLSDITAETLLQLLKGKLVDVILVQIILLAIIQKIMLLLAFLIGQLLQPVETVLRTHIEGEVIIDLMGFSRNLGKIGLDFIKGFLHLLQVHLT